MTVKNRLLLNRTCARRYKSQFCSSVLDLLAVHVVTGFVKISRTSYVRKKHRDVSSDKSTSTKWQDCVLTCKHFCCAKSRVETLSHGAEVIDWWNGRQNVRTMLAVVVAYVNKCDFKSKFNGKGFRKS